MNYELGNSGTCFSFPDGYCCINNNSNRLVMSYEKEDVVCLVDIRKTDYSNFNQVKEAIEKKIPLDVVASNYFYYTSNKEQQIQFNGYINESTGIYNIRGVFKYKDNQFNAKNLMDELLSVMLPEDRMMMLYQEYHLEKVQVLKLIHRISGVCNHLVLANVVHEPLSSEQQVQELLQDVVLLEKMVESQFNQIANKLSVPLDQLDDEGKEEVLVFVNLVESLWKMIQYSM